jgi:glycosyltransferase involved in cell wall biosynthesis
MITLTVPCLLLGGTEFQTLQLVRALVGLKEKPMVLVYFEFEPEMVRLFEQEGAKVTCLNWSRSISPWAFIHQFKKVVKELKPETIHVQYMAPGALPIIAAKLAGVKRIIATVHQPYTSSHGWKSKLLLRFSALFCRPFLSVSQNAERSWFGSSKLINNTQSISQQPKHLTMHNAVDCKRIQAIADNSDKEKLRHSLELNGKIIIGTVSRLRHEKGIDLLITAFTEVHKQYDNTHLLLVGDGPDRTNYEQMVKDNKIAYQVTFLGAAEWEHAIKYTSIMDIVVIPSRFEGFGLTAAEAMAMGKPIVAANNYGLKELIKHQETGLLFTNEDSNALKEELITIMAQHERSLQLGLHAKEKVQDLFDTGTFNQNVKVLYGL